MKIDFPPPSLLREPLGSGSKRPCSARAAVAAGGLARFAPAVTTLLVALLLSALIGCGGSSVEPPSEPEGCEADAECGEGQQCVDTACIAASPPPSASAGFFACSVMRCPNSEPSCCLGVEASATGN